MRTKLFPAILLTLLCFARPVYCQITTAPGFVVQASGDTLRGRLEFANTNLPGRRAFIPAASGRLSFLNTGAIREYCINQEVHFKTVPLKGKKVAMQVLSEGRLNLYQYKNDLFVRSKTDSLVKLTGGNKTVDQNGKKYAVVDYSYKSQLRNALPENGYNARIDQLPFDRKEINRFAQEINQAPAVRSKPGLSNRHQFGVQAGFSRTALEFLKTNYNANDLISYSPEELTDVRMNFGGEPYIDELTVTSLKAEVFYRRKVSRRYSYLKVGLGFENAFEVKQNESKGLYQNVISDNGPVGLSGYMKDRYSYKAMALNIPFSYTGEFTSGRWRPFADLGLNARMFLKREFKLEREVAIGTDPAVRAESDLNVKLFRIRPMLGTGCRYLCSNNTSVAVGLSYEPAFVERLYNPGYELERTTSFYISYGF